MKTTEDQALACFAHGLAHLMMEIGYERGLAKAGASVLHLLETGCEGESIGETGRDPCARGDRLTR